MQRHPIAPRKLAALLSAMGLALAADTGCYAGADATDEGPLAAFSMTERDRYELKMAGLLHDCGKITTPVHVVDKATKLETLFDRIHLIDTRFEVLLRDAEIAHLKGELGADDYQRRIAALNHDRQVLRRSNTGGEFMSDEQVAEITRIAAHAPRWRLLGKRAANGVPLTDIEQEIAAQLRQNRPRDQAAGRTTEGVHRTDLKVIHAAKGLPADQCSTGEQKALLIGLILANAQALFERDFAPSPLLLLDEAAAHLDSDRRAALYDELAALGGQAWLTGTDRNLFDAFGDRAQRFEVSDGVVREG